MSNETLSQWLAPINPEQYGDIEAQLEAMGVPRSTLSISHRPCTEELPGSWADPRLSSVLKTHGLFELKAGGQTVVRMLSPKEVLAQAGKVTRPAVPNAEDFAPLVIGADGAPLLLVHRYEGKERFGIENRYAILTDDKDAWDSAEIGTTFGWGFDSAMRQVFVPALMSGLSKQYKDPGETTLGKPLKPKKKEAAGQAKACDVPSAWKVIQKYLKAQCEDEVKLQRGAPAKRVAALEAKLGVHLPEAMRTSWQKHDGDDESGALGGWSLLSLEDIEREALSWRGFTSEGRAPSEDPRIAPKWWDEAWVPFASSGSGDFLVVDLTSSGKGQVFRALMDPPDRKVVAASFEAWLGRYAQALGNEITFEDGWNGSEALLDGVQT